MLPVTLHTAPFAELALLLGIAAGCASIAIRTE